MGNWILFGSAGNPSYEITKAWLKNHGIPFENRSIYRINKEEIDRLKELTVGGIKDLVYPNTFSYLLVNPQKGREKDGINKIQNNEVSEEEAIDLLTVHPFLMVTPILTDFNNVIVGYNYDELVTTFRNVKVKDVRMA
jgi:arsenate reductase-like glutaredoxin family protein